MFIDIVPNRTSPPAVLLREAYREENGRPQKRTLANLSKLPPGVIEALKVLLKGGSLSGTEPRELAIERSLPHGHVAAVSSASICISTPWKRLHSPVSTDASKSGTPGLTLFLR